MQYHITEGWSLQVQRPRQDSSSCQRRRARHVDEGEPALTGVTAAGRLYQTGGHSCNSRNISRIADWCLSTTGYCVDANMRVPALTQHYRGGPAKVSKLHVFKMTPVKRNRSGFACAGLPHQTHVIKLEDQGFVFKHPVDVATFPTLFRVLCTVTQRPVFFPPTSESWSHIGEVGCHRSGISGTRTVAQKQRTGCHVTKKKKTLYATPGGSHVHPPSWPLTLRTLA